MSATPLRAGAGMCRVPLPYHASAPHRVSLATLPLRSGVRNDGEKITIRVARASRPRRPTDDDHAGSVREAREHSRDWPRIRNGDPYQGRQTGQRLLPAASPGYQSGLAMGPLGTRLNERGSGRGVVGRFTRGASEATRRFAMVGEASVARGALSAARCATAGSPGTPPRSEWRSRCPACRVSSWC